MDARMIQIGQRISHVRYGNGVVTAIRGQQNPSNVRPIFAGMISGGAAYVSMVFGSGIATDGVPEAIVRSLPWRFIDDELATPEEIAELKGDHEAMTRAADRKREEAIAEHITEAMRLRAAPEWAYLTQSSEDDAGNCGKLAAANMRKELRKAFPGVKISVRKAYYGEVHISWVGGPTNAEVEATTGKYSDKSFDGSRDLESSAQTAWTEVFGGGGYCNCNHRDATAVSG